MKRRSGIDIGSSREGTAQPISTRSSAAVPPEADANDEAGGGEPEPESLTGDGGDDRSSKGSNRDSTNSIGVVLYSGVCVWCDVVPIAS